MKIYGRYFHSSVIIQTGHVGASLLGNSISEKSNALILTPNHKFASQTLFDLMEILSILMNVWFGVNVQASLFSTGLAHM